MVAAGLGRAPSRGRTPGPRAEPPWSAGRGPYSLQEASDAIGARAGEGRSGLSASAIQKLRTGSKTNPTMRTIESLARVFGVAPQYFFGDAPPAG